MKKTILFLLLAVLSAVTVSAQETKKAHYIIDCKPVENFDGSQLNGKTIVNYTIDPENNIHVILTSEYEAKEGKVGGVKILTTTSAVKDNSDFGVISESIRAVKAGDIVCVLDGKVVPYSEIQSISPSKIDSMKVIKDKKDSDYVKYAKELGYEPKCIMMITSK